jgi:hypothetical protein
VVGVAAFDLTAAFDTVDKAQLVTKLTALGITGKARSWFESYLSGGQQCVDWNGARSGHIFIEFGVRQGSILGPLLYLILVADMPDCVGIGSTCNSGYADDTAIWAVGTLEQVRHTLEERASLFISFTKGNGLSLNASNTQLLVGGVSSKDLAGFSILVDGIKVNPSPTLELLGVTFDRNSILPHTRVRSSERRFRLNFNLFMVRSRL